MGNLTILTQELNSSVSNGGWVTKKPALLAASLLPINQKLHAVEHWDESAIELRSDELFAIAITAWPGPQPGHGRRPSSPPSRRWATQVAPRHRPVREAASLPRQRRPSPVCSRLSAARSRGSRPPHSADHEPAETPVKELVHDGIGRDLHVLVEPQTTQAGRVVRRDSREAEFRLRHVGVEEEGLVGAELLFFRLLVAHLGFEVDGRARSMPHSGDEGRLKARPWAMALPQATRPP